MDHVEKLKQLRQEITKIGHQMLKEKVPIPVNEATKFLEPFAKIEKQIDKIIKNTNPQNFKK